MKTRLLLPLVLAVVLLPAPSAHAGGGNACHWSTAFELPELPELKAHLASCRKAERPCEPSPLVFGGTLSEATVTRVAALDRTTPAALRAAWMALDARALDAATADAARQNLDAASADRYVAARIVAARQAEAARLLDAHPELQMLAQGASKGASLGDGPLVPLAALGLLATALAGALRRRFLARA